MKNAIADLDTSYPAVPASVGYARAAVVALAALAGAGEEALDRVRLAVSEAVSNVVVHAYGGNPAGAVQIIAAAIDGELTIVVADHGCGLGDAAESPGLGFGIALMTSICDSLTYTTRSSGGTEVALRLSLQSSPTAVTTISAPWQ